MASNTRIFTSAIQQSTDTQNQKAPAGSKNVQVPAKRGKHSVFERFDDWDTTTTTVRAPKLISSGKGLISDSSGEFSLLKNSSTTRVSSSTTGRARRSTTMVNGVDGNNHSMRSGRGYDITSRSVLSSGEGRRAPYGVMRSRADDDTVPMIDIDSDFIDVDGDDSLGMGLVRNKNKRQRALPSKCYTGATFDSSESYTSRRAMVEAQQHHPHLSTATGSEGLINSSRSSTRQTFAPTALAAAVNAAVADTTTTSSGGRRWCTSSSISTIGRWGSVHDTLGASPVRSSTGAAGAFGRSNRSREVAEQLNMVDGDGEWQHDMFGVVESEGADDPSAVISSGGYYHPAASSSTGMGGGGGMLLPVLSSSAAALEAAVVGSRLFIRSLGNNCTKLGIEDVFGGVDKVVSIAIERGPLTTAIVGFRKRGSAQQAVELLQGTVVQGQCVKLAVMPSNDNKVEAENDYPRQQGSTTATEYRLNNNSRYNEGYDVVQHLSSFGDLTADRRNTSSKTRRRPRPQLLQLAQQRSRRRRANGEWVADSAVHSLRSRVVSSRLNTAVARRMMTGPAPATASTAAAAVLSKKQFGGRQHGERLRGGALVLGRIGRRVNNKFLPNDQNRQSVFKRLTDN
eukprot:Lankesteria_metandrocarpae@DN2695_c0_g1_i1.p1